MMHWPTPRLLALLTLLTALSCSTTETVRVCEAFPDDPLCLEENTTSPTPTPECTSNAECTTATASRCNDAGQCAACETDADCNGITGAGACNAGTCVECTPQSDAACNGNVCDPSTFTCTTVVKNSVASCKPCTFDDQCSPGMLCVESTFNGVSEGPRCLWRKDFDNGPNTPQGNCGGNISPYFETRLAKSVGGIETEVCALRTTSCTGIEHFSNGGRGENNSCESTETADTPDSSLCGMEGQDDAFCVKVNTTFRCTNVCLNAPDDCLAPKNGADNCIDPMESDPQDPVVPENIKVCEL